MKIAGKTIDIPFYGDQSRWFIGTVIQNTGDPMINHLGRVKVRIVGIHESIDDHDLPWASVLLPTTSGGINAGFGPRLQNLAQVFGIFLDGNQSQTPLILGSIPFNISELSEANRPVTGSAFSGTSATSVTAGPDGPAIDQPSPTAAGEECYTYFRSVGFSDAAARGIYGNLYVESAQFDPNVINFIRRGDNGSAYGIAQWRNSRVTGEKGLFWFAQSIGQDPKSLGAQFRFIKYELDTIPSYGKAGLNTCTTPGQAAVWFMRTYEIPAYQGGISAYADPPWAASPFPRARAGENERIQAATDTEFSGV